MKSPVLFFSAPADLDARVERVRQARAVGGELPPKAAVLRAALAAGLDVIEAPPAPPEVAA